MMIYVELQIDGLTGPSHNYGGLSLGNFASQKNKYKGSSPLKAFKQCLEKMRRTHELGVNQAFIPPIETPRFDLLHNIGYDVEGDLNNILRDIDDELLSVIWSASFMWTANCCTFTPSIDSRLQRPQISVSNLSTHIHRMLECDMRYQQLRHYMPYDVYPGLFPHDRYSDEGAANHLRLCPNHSSRGLHVFVYNKDENDQMEDKIQGSLIPKRQSKQAFEAIARRHQIPDNQVVYIKQSDLAVINGVFHNDMIGLSNE